MPASEVSPLLGAPYAIARKMARLLVLSICQENQVPVEDL